MPRNYRKAGSFKASGWEKMIRGKRLRIHCGDLNLPEELWTKDGSYQAAADHWAKLAGDGEARVTALGEIMASESAQNIAEGLSSVMDDYIEAERERKLEGVPEDEFGAIVRQKVNERLDKMKAIGIKSDAPTPKDFTLSHHAARFLELERAKNNRPRTYGELSESINAMLDTEYKGLPVLSPEMDVRAIDKTTVENYFLFLRHRSGRVPAQQKKQWGFFKRLVRYLWESEFIDLPKNLDSSSFAFKVTASKIEEYTVDEVKAALKALPDRLRLYALLAVNCGMLTVDIGNLLKSEVDLKAGRIKRKRTKTSEEKDVPEVDYKLWPATLKLLRKCYSDHPTLALTSKTGTKLWEHWIGDDGKEHEKNLITLQWKKAKSEIPLKAFRSIGATIIGKNREYGRYVGHYLGHSPKSMADKHYVAPSRELFDEIIDWLEKTLGITK